MEGKNVMMMSGVLVFVVVVLGQIRVGAAAQLCCPDDMAAYQFKLCRAGYQTSSLCAAVAGCIIADVCPAGWANQIQKTRRPLCFPCCCFGTNIQVGAVGLLCCPTAKATRSYKLYRDAGTPQTICAQQTGCTVSDVARCPNRLTNEIRENTSSVNEYCKLECVSSVCGAITTLQHSDASEVVNGAVEKCADACSVFCTRGAVPTA